MQEIFVVTVVAGIIVTVGARAAFVRKKGAGAGCGDCRGCTCILKEMKQEWHTPQERNETGGSV